MNRIALSCLLAGLVTSCSSPTPQIIVITAIPPPSPQIIVVTTTPAPTVTPILLPLPFAFSSLTPLAIAHPTLDPNLANKIRWIGCITYDDAVEFIGQLKCVGGIVTTVFQDPGSATTFINFEAARTGFYAVSFKERYDDLKSKCVLVYGKIDRYLGRPQIIVNDRSQIRLCE